MKKSTCKIDIELLRSDMTISGNTIASVSKDSENGFGKSTLVRALAGRNINISKARKIAIALGMDEDRYIIENEKLYYQDTNLGGEWYAFFVQDPRGIGPETVRERLVIEQSGRRLTGLYARASDGIGEDFTMSAFREGRIIYGTFRVPGRKTTDGLGVFQLSEKEMADWFEGYCTWVDTERPDEITISKNIWVRKKSTKLNELLKSVKYIMEEEKKLLAARRITEAY